jgi:hypothetical protein
VFADPDGLLALGRTDAALSSFISFVKCCRFQCEPVFNRDLLDCQSHAEHHAGVPHWWVAAVKHFNQLQNLTGQLVLFKLKPNVSQAQLTEFSIQGSAMVGKIPGMFSVILW